MDQYIDAVSLHLSLLAMECSRICFVVVVNCLILLEEELWCRFYSLGVLSKIC